MQKKSHCVHPCVCSKSPYYVVVQYIKFEILNRDMASVPLHQIALYRSRRVQVYNIGIFGTFFHFKKLVCKCFILPLFLVDCIIIIYLIIPNT